MGGGHRNRCEVGDSHMDRWRTRGLVQGFRDTIRFPRECILSRDSMMALMTSRFIREMCPENGVVEPALRNPLGFRQNTFRRIGEGAGPLFLAESR